MSYQVLARKWRPQTFAQLVGQQHVVAAISNALDNDRLHHAYLFTGTRGVGKTTIARIFSKSLNCEQGMGSQPCGQCSTCVEIEQGNFVDLLEIDAASRTKVEDTRELLDNVQYKPTRGRYKVYLIDEVHMLSKHSFNALLKTLEEPPPHVKFLLATTDPQKLPVTILSRCLQFSLKALSRGQIGDQLQHILGQESISFEDDAIAQLARAAQGSMRDALSLTDQAIAQGNGQVANAVVTDMLGLLDKNKILKLLNAILRNDASGVFSQVEELAVQSPDYEQVLVELISLLHQVAMTQMVPDACKLETISPRAIFQLAKSHTAEDIQLQYQIALQGRKDIAFAADGRSGLEMTLLRMLAFKPTSKKVSPDQLNQLTQNNAEVDFTEENDETQQALEQQQQHILQQAEGFKPLEAEPVPAPGEMEQVTEPQESETVFPDAMFPDATPDVEMPEPEQTAPVSHTENLLALKAKLRQPSLPKDNDESKKPEAPIAPAPEPVREAESEPLTEVETLRVDEPVYQESIEPAASESQSSAAIEFTAENIGAEMPPWLSPEYEQAPPPFELTERPPVELESPQAISFDAAQEQLDAPMDLDIPVFNPSGDKVLSASQLDTWSQLIEQLAVTALTKQLALHSSFAQQGNMITLTLLESKEHLNSESARLQLQQGLQEALQMPVELTVQLGQPVNVPAAIQQGIKARRQAYAHEVMETDPAVTEIKTLFNARVLEDSIEPR